MGRLPLADPSSETWVIAFDVNLDKVLEFIRDPQNDEKLKGKSVKDYENGIRSSIFTEIYNILITYGFSKRLQNSLVFNNSMDATVAFRAVTRGLAQNWVKYFIKRLHLFKVDPNSDASDLLNKEQLIEKHNRPDWFDDDLLHFLNQSEYDDDFEDSLFFE